MVMTRFEARGSRFKAGDGKGASTRTVTERAAGAAEAGFTLLELMIVMIIIATLAAIAIPAYTRNVRNAKEAVLKADLRIMRDAIGSYTVDKEKAPQSLDDLVSAGYLREIPKDPITGRTDTWVTSQSDVLESVDQTDSGGIDDVHSGAQGTATDGSNYSTW